LSSRVGATVLKLQIDLDRRKFRILKGFIDKIRISIELGNI